MKKLMVMLVLMSMVVAASPAMAAKEGDFELTLGGSGSNDENFDGAVFNIEAGLGYFITQNLEAVLRQGVSYADVPDSDNWNGSTRFSIDYNFDLGELTPYLGVNIGYLYGDTVKDQFIAGPEAGVKYFVNDTTFIVGGLEYQFLFEEAKDADDNFDDGRFVYILGIGFQY
jgi:hypothetical protein